MKTIKQLVVLAISAAAISSTAASAAQILSQSRSLQAIVDAADSNPAVGNEVSDFSNAPSFGTYNANAGVTYPFNNNLAATTASQNTTIDTVALRIGGSGNMTTHIDTRFDSNDVASGAFANTQGSSSVSVAFKLDNSGKVHIALTLGVTTSAMDTSGSPVAEAIVQTATGTMLWHQLITSTNQIAFNGDVPLVAGSYQLIVMAGSNITDAKVGGRLIDTSAAFTVDATINEDAGKPRKRK